MKVRSRIYLSSLLTVGLISTMVVFLFIFSLKINRELEREAAVDEVVKGFIRLVLVADDFMAYPYERKSRQWNAQYEKMAGLLQADAETGTYKELVSRFHLLGKLFEKLRIEMAKNPESVVIERVMGRIRWVSHDLINHGYEIIAEKNQRVLSLQRKSTIFLFSISLLLVIVSVLTSWIIIRSIATPLKRLTRDVNQIREGNFALIPEEKRKEKTENEFGTLSRAFHAMAARLARTINELRSSESALRESEQLLNNAIDSAPIGMVLVKPDGYFFRINRAFRTITGYEEDELLKKTFQDIIHPEDHDIGEEMVHKLLSGEEKEAHFKKRYLHKNGTSLHMQLTTVLLRDDHGKPLYFFTQAVNITEQKRVEEDLRKRNDYIQAILDRMPIGFALHTIDDGVNRYVNDKFQEFYGWPKEDMATVDLFFNNVFPDPVYREKFQARVLADMESGDPDRMIWEDMPITTKSGEKRFATAFNIPLIHQNLMISTVQDTTLRKKAEDKVRQNREHLEELVEKRTSALETTNLALEAANTELKDFAYIISHDLKAPLRAVSQLSYWIREDHGDNLGDEGKEKISLLINRVKRMDGLINGILQYSRIGRTREKKEKINLNTLVHRVLDAISSPEEIDIAILNSLPTITGDPTRMEQIFQNLLSNAIKFMNRPDGIIQVRCDDEKSKWRFSVKDNGPGIDPKYHDRIFKIFQTLSSRDEQENTGIGLTLVKKIVELYGGKVWVESEVSQGSTFFFTLPKG